MRKNFCLTEQVALDKKGINVNSTNEETDSNSSDPSLLGFYMSFGDLMVILCCFFVLMHSISRVDTGSFEKIRTQFTGTVKGSLVDLHRRIRKVSRSLKDVSISLDSDGLRINLETAALFEVRSAVLRRGALAPLDRILAIVKNTRYQLDVEGHTDDQNLYHKKGGLVETNWSLSGLRASTVVHHLLQLGFDEKRIRIVGYASNRPRIKVARKKGASLDRARQANRRVSLLIH